MAIFGPAEWPRVALVRPELRATVLDVMKAWEVRFPGQKLFVPEKGGFRGEGVQEGIYTDSLASGFRASPAGYSMHEYGAAIDLQIVGTEQNATKDKADQRYRALADIAVASGLRAGFYFSGGLPDPYHFELAESLDVARATWEGLKKKESRRVSSSSLPSSLGL